MAASISFQATDTDNGTIGASGTHTFTLTVAAAAGQERIVAIGGIGANAAGTDYTACTIDGQTGTRIGSVSRGANDGGNTCAFLTFYRANGTSGTTINVVATKDSSGSGFSGNCALWTLNDAGTVVATTNAATNDPTLSTNTTTDGVAVAALIGYSGTAPSVAWTGLTENFDSISVFGNDVFSGASAAVTSGGSPRSISVNITPDLAVSIASICISFNPAEPGTSEGGGGGQQIIDIGDAINDGTGDPVREAFDKCNDNFTELYEADTTFLTTMTAAATYAPVASPTLTGNPKSVTPSPGDNDTSIATTAFVTAAIAAIPAATTTVAPPQGRLTLQTATPVMTTTQSAKTTIFYTPYVGNQIPLYNGTSLVPTTFTELSVATTDTTKSPAAIGASKVIDWFIWNDAGTLRIGHGPDWISDTARSAGTALVMVNGIWLNNASVTNGPAASRGTYVGTTRSNAAGTLDWIPSPTPAAGGNPASLNVWNAYNRVPVIAVEQDTTANWFYNGVERDSHGSTNNSIRWVEGLGECWVESNFLQLTNPNGTAGTTVYVTIALSAGTATTSKSYDSLAGGALTSIAKAIILPSAGARSVQAREEGFNGGTFYGGTNFYLFTVTLEM